MKFRAKILGINGVLGFDSIGITLLKYLEASEDELSKFEMESVFCETDYTDLKFGDLIIIKNKEFPQTALAYPEEFFNSEIEEADPQFVVIAKLQVKREYNDVLVQNEKKQILEKLEFLMGNLGKEIITIQEGVLSIDTSDLTLTDEIKELIERYNSL